VPDELVGGCQNASVPLGHARGIMRRRLPLLLRVPDRRPPGRRADRID
jgi:hypothetical protein